VARGDQRFLGSHETEEGANFAIWAAAATKVELCFIDEVDGKLVETRHELVDRNGPIFHGYFEGIRAGQKYGYRIYGLWDPLRGWRFNPHKLLMDPNAHAVWGELQYVPEIYSHVASDGSGSGDTTVMDTRDNLGFVPLSVVTRANPANDPRLRTAWSRTIIYEAHVRGFTEFNPAIPENERGTYKALGHPSTIEYLQTLGITALELLPVHEFVSEPSIVARGRENYWGYNPIAFSAPHRGYAATNDPIAELREAVEKLHEAGIEVILDVVYNHTGEGGVGGPTLSFRGIDSKTFYRRITGDIYDDVTGCGNTVDARRPHVVRTIIDSLHWWCTEIGVDGFRFDLAAALARDHGDIDGISALIVAIVADPFLRERKLIAEPWDTKGYALGGFPYPWREWNDKYRDAVRKFWLAEAGGEPANGVGELATRLSGSHDIFTYRGPTSTINFLTAHDGFTLNDLVTYSQKHNEANGESNRDGTNTNHSWNVGVEGPTEDHYINNIRQRLKKSLMGSLLMSAGIPMLVMGDEVGRSQLGSNNAYSLPAKKRGSELQDEDAFGGGWALNWSHDVKQLDMLMTTINLISIRRKYLMPVVRMFFSGELDLNTSRRDLAWFSRHGHEMDSEGWNKPEAHTLGMYVEATEDQGLLILINNNSQPREFILPPANYGSSFRSVFDSAENVLTYEPKLENPGAIVLIPAHGLQVWFANRSVAN
jgi:glycogen operon protein